MTLRELLEKISKEKPNSFDEDTLIGYINEIERDCAEELRYDKQEVPIYTAADIDNELIVPAPYDRVYVSYVKAMIDYANEEYGSYQLNQEQHVRDFADFANWAVRTRFTEQGMSPTRLRNVF